MFRLTITIHPDDEDDLVTRLHGTPLTGLGQTNRDDGLVDFEAWYTTQQDAENAWALTNPDRQGGDPIIDEIQNQNWNAPYQNTWQPMEIGSRWYLAPPADESPRPKNRLRLQLKPGLAFGNGDHPTTHLCLIAMEHLVSKGDIFLDVGCGSGLLSEAAHLLGATAFGCDLDPTDLPTNSFIGSVEAIKSQSIDVAVMNIQAGILVDLWPELARVTKRHAILSGFLPGQLPLIEALIQSPWQITQTLEKQGWCALLASSQLGWHPGPMSLSFPTFGQRRDETTRSEQEPLTTCVAEMATQPRT